MSSPVRVRTMMRAALVLGVALSACGEEDDDLVGDQVVVRGIVRDEGTKARLKDAQVVFMADTLETGSERTNEDGEFSIAVEARSSHGRIEASKAGYQPRTVSVFVDEASVQIDVELPRAN